MVRTKPLIVIGLVGSVLDGAGRLAKAQSLARWDRWRPSVDLVRHAHLPVARLELLHQPEHKGFADVVAQDVEKISAAQVRLHALAMRDPWDFEEVYGALFDFCKRYPFKPDDEDYLVHITTGTHVAQICWFLLAESKHVPGRLLQTSPSRKDDNPDRLGQIAIIDLDLSRYDRLRTRFAQEVAEGVSSLKQGVPTTNARYNALIEELEHVASQSTAPILLQGPTGTGKTQLARRIYDLKKARRQVQGPFVEVNCATLRGDGAMSTLFGHRKGAFTGALSDREGLLKRADGGLLFLDEVGELGLDEQAMLLRALEEKRFLPLGADQETTSSFQFLCGTHRDLRACVKEKRFREDLLARIDIWSFPLPPLRERLDDLAPNLDVELQRASAARGEQITMNREARDAFLRFATNDAPWPGNFRELSASVERLATLCRGGRIDAALVLREMDRKRAEWAQTDDETVGPRIVREHLGEAAADVDDFDAVQLAHVLRVCLGSRSLADAGRKLFAASRKKRTSTNDSDRLRKYLASFGLAFEALRPPATRGGAPAILDPWPTTSPPSRSRRRG